MSDRTLHVLVAIQGAALLLLVADRVGVVPTAQAQGIQTVRCEVDNWPDVLTNTGFATMRVKIQETDKPLPVVVKDWDTSDRVKVGVEAWNTNSELRVNVTNWDTSDVVNTRQQ